MSRFANKGPLPKPAAKPKADSASEIAAFGDPPKRRRKRTEDVGQ